MRSLVLAILLFPTLSQAAVYRAKFDLLESAPAAIGVRDLKAGDWLGGFSKQIGSVRRDDLQLLALSGFSAWDAGGGHSAYGLGLGVPLGSLGQNLQRALNVLTPSSDLSGLKTALGFVSLDFYAGYRSRQSDGLRHLMYGYGGKVEVPLDLKALVGGK